MKNKSKKVNLSFRRRVSSYYSRFTLLIKLCLIIFIGLFFFTNFFTGFKNHLRKSAYDFAGQHGFILHNVIIEGQKNLPSEEIIAAIGHESGSPIFAINLEVVRKNLEDKPWVKAALVERRLPDNLYIAILEREPIAIWQFQQKLYLVDEDGTRITNQNIEKFSSLLHVVGVDANIYAKNLIEDLAKHAGLAKRVVSAVRYGQRRWNLNLEQNITVKMPEDGFDKAYDYLASLNQKDKLFGQNYKSLDLRDPQKYYINQEEEKKE